MATIEEIKSELDAIMDKHGIPEMPDFERITRIFQGAKCMFVLSDQGGVMFGDPTEISISLAALIDSQEEAQSIVLRALDLLKRKQEMFPGGFPSQQTTG